MRVLHRLTTDYVEEEDRIRVSGASANGDTVVLWLTQRLLNRLVPHLTAWLAAQVTPGAAAPAVQAAHRDIVQGFAQQAARAQLTPQPPVLAAAPAASWRVTSVDLSHSAQAVLLTLKGEGEAAQLKLPAQALRQWLGILYAQYQRGEWPTAVWPAWMSAATAPPQNQPGTAVLH